MTLLSKPLSDKEKDFAHQKVVETGMIGCCTQNVQLLSDTALITAACSGDVGQAASVLALTSSMAGATEFFLNPVLGKMADQYGRKWIYYVGPIVSGVLGSVAVLVTEGKNLKVLMLHRAMSWGLLSLSNSFIGPVTISDMYQGPDLAIRTAKLFGSYGLTIIGAPLFGSLVFQTTGNHMNVFKFRLLFALLQLYYASKFVPETLTAERVMPFKLMDANPFSFFRLFSRSPTLRTVTLMLFFNCFAEGKNIVSLTQGWINGSPLAWSAQKQSAWTTLYGMLAFIAGVKVMPILVKKTGPRGFTSLTNCLNAIGLTILGVPLPSYDASVVIGTLVHGPGINNTSAAAMKAIGIDHAVGNGFGRGEYGGMYSGLRTFSQILAPIIFGAAYNRATAAKKPGILKMGSCFFLVALLGAVLPELLHRSLSDQDLKVPSAAPPIAKAKA